MRVSTLLLPAVWLAFTGPAWADHDHDEPVEEVHGSHDSAPSKRTTSKTSPPAPTRKIDEHLSHHDGGDGGEEKLPYYVPADQDRLATPREIADVEQLHRGLDTRLERMKQLRWPSDTAQAIKNIATNADGALHAFSEEVRSATGRQGREMALSEKQRLQAAIKATDMLTEGAIDLLRNNYQLKQARSEEERQKLRQRSGEILDGMYKCLEPNVMPAEFHNKAPTGGSKPFGLMAPGSPFDIKKDLEVLEQAAGRGGSRGHNDGMSRGARSPDEFNYIARFRSAMKDYKGAEEDASSALGMDPKNGDALTIRADARYNLRDYGGALADARAALAIDPGNESARGTAHYASNRLGPDLAAPKAASPFSSGDGGANLGGGAGMTGPVAANNTPEGRQSAQLVNDAMRAFQIKDLAAARAALDKAIEINPGNADAHAKRAWLNSHEGRTGDALASVKSVLKLDPRKGPAMATRLAAELNRQGRYGEARDVLSLLSAEQRDAESWYQLARAQRGLGSRDAMMASLKRAAELDPAGFGAKYQQALSAGVDEDLAFLFGDGTGEGRPSGAAKGKGSGNRMLLTSLAVIVGGFLVALGLLHIITAQWTRRFTTRIRMALGGAGLAEVGVTPLEESRETPESSAPTIAGTYELVRQIGLGGMGIVYECVDRGLGRRVAVKKMREEIRVDPRERERFITEARTVANLKHPNIVEIHSIVEDGADLFLVFEFVEGTTLYELLDRRGRLTLPEATRVVEQAGEALAYAHKRDVIHRDLKPSNIMIGDGGAVKVMDFGVARQAKDAVSKLSMTNTIVGTPPYMAPEQEQGLVCKESDVYALAVCFYELVTGRLPFQGTGAGMLLNKMNKSYAPPSTLAPELPSALDPIFAKAFEPEPARRFRTVAELLSALRGVRA